MDFKVFTNALKAYEGPNGDLFVTGTTSSTIRDLHGDEMTLNAIETMANTAKQNMTIFLNHNYNVPQDLFGSVKDARVVKRYDVESNSEVYDLDIDVLVCKEDENPEAMRAFKAIKRGVKLGLSIGARVDRVSKKKDARTGDDTYVIDAVKLMEASVVGIPANQRSYLQNALKSLKAAEQSGEKGIFDLEESTEIDSSPAVSIDAAGIVDEYEQKGDVDSSANSLLAEGEIIVGDAEKATRVTVTVTQSDDKETKKPEASENIQDEAVSAASDVSKSEQESPVETETAVDVAPEADPAVEAPVEAPVDEPVEAPVEEPVVEEVNAAHEALQALGAVLVRASAGERAHILSKVAEFADGETATVAEAEVAEAVVTEGEPVADEAQEVAQEIVEANGLDEVTAIAKSALDAAFAAQQEVSLIKSQLTELIAQKAKVESDLAKALDVVGRLMDLPSGRKAYSSASINSGTNAPWLSPVIQRMLDSQE